MEAGRGRGVAWLIDMGEGDDPLKRLETLSHQLDAASRAARHTIAEIAHPKHRTDKAITKAQPASKAATYRRK